MPKTEQLAKQRTGDAVNRAVVRFAGRILLALEEYRPIVRLLGPMARMGRLDGRPELGVVLRGVDRLSDEMDCARAIVLRMARDEFVGLTAFRVVVAGEDDCRAPCILEGDEIHRREPVDG